MTMMMETAHAQRILYNQYNAVMAEMNPAFIAHLEADYTALAGRWQWPGYVSGAQMGSFAFNKQVAAINSSFGLMARALTYDNNSCAQQSVSLVYGYRVVVLDRFLLSLGTAIGLQQERFVWPAYDDGFDPGRNTQTHLLPAFDAKTITGRYGFLFHGFEPSPDWYLGFSVKQHVLYAPEGNTLRGKPAFSVQLMRAMAITRRLKLYGFLSADHNPAVKVTANNRTLTVQTAYTALLLQLNMVFNGRFSIGTGYKYFTHGYGSLHYRFSYTTPRKKNAKKFSDRPVHPFTFGLSYDIKPYIQNNSIHSFSSYEFYIKYKLPVKK